MSDERRAALVNRMRAIFVTSEGDDWHRMGRALDLALEEAARVAETCEWWKVPLNDDDERAPIAAAIRALKWVGNGH